MSAAFTYVVSRTSYWDCEYSHTQCVAAYASQELAQAHAERAGAEFSAAVEILRSHRKAPAPAITLALDPEFSFDEHTSASYSVLKIPFVNAPLGQTGLHPWALERDHTWRRNETLETAMGAAFSKLKAA